MGREHKSLCLSDLCVTEPGKVQTIQKMKKRGICRGVEKSNLGQ